MGCNGSKTTESKVLMHCKERREWMEATVDGRYALASAHAAYSRALIGMGDAVYRFVQDEISVASSPAHLSSPPSLSPIGSTSWSVSEEPDLHLHLSDDQYGSFLSSSVNHGENGFPISGGRSSNQYHMKNKPAAIPNVVPKTPQPATSDHLYVYPLNGEDVGDHGKNLPKYSTTPLPPPPPASASWDFLNLFGWYEDNIYPGHRIGSVTSSINTAEVREKEGIPELEDELEDDAMEETKKKNKMRKVEAAGNECSSSSASATIKRPLWQEVGEGHPLEEESVGSTTPAEAMIGDGRRRLSEGCCWAMSGRKELAAFDGETSLSTEESVPSVGTALYREGTRDVRKVVAEIREDFKVAADVGQQMAAMLQVGRCRYPARRRRRDSTPFGDLLSTLAYSLPSFRSARRPLTDTFGTTEAKEAAANNRNCTIGDDPSAIDKLYAWEEKLFEEVEKEESLGLEYEKRFRRLQQLLEHGAEASKIRSAERLVGEVIARIDVSVKSIASISRTIRKLRDEELQPYLIALIEGFGRMWSCSLECHRKQYRAVVDIRTSNVKLKPGPSSAMAAVELERGLLNWSACFDDLISAQMDYVEALNRWLMTTTTMFFGKRPPVFTARDGVVVPFPPGKLGAPPALVTSQDWWHAMRTAPAGDEVATAMRASATNVGELLRTKQVERREKLRLESLLRDYDRRRRDSAIRKPNGRLLLCSYVHPLEHEGVRRGGGGQVSWEEEEEEEEDGTMPAGPDPMGRRLREAKERHEDIAEQVREQTVGILRTSLVPILEAMGRYIKDTQKAHQSVRGPNF